MKTFAFLFSLDKVSLVGGERMFLDASLWEEHKETWNFLGILGAYSNLYR